MTAQIYKDSFSTLGAHWVCRLYEPGGYVWHGQVAKTDFRNISESEFVAACQEEFGEITLA